MTFMGLEPGGIDVRDPAEVTGICRLSCSLGKDDIWDIGVAVIKQAEVMGCCCERHWPGPQMRPCEQPYAHLPIPVIVWLLG